MDIAARMHLKVPETTDYYDGSRAFTWLSDLSGLPIDQVSEVMGARDALLCRIDLFSQKRLKYFCQPLSCRTIVTALRLSIFVR